MSQEDQLTESDMHLTHDQDLSIGITPELDQRNTGSEKEQHDSRVFVVWYGHYVSWCYVYAPIPTTTPATSDGDRYRRSSSYATVASKIKHTDHSFLSVCYRM